MDAPEMTVNLPDSHLTEPNYYRLAYQLAAQKTHAYLAGAERTAGASTEPTNRPQSARDLLMSREQCLRDAQTSAEELTGEATDMLVLLSAREDSPWRYMTFRASGASEKRLKEFLSKMVLPSAELLLAGILVIRQEGTRAEELAQPIRGQLARADLSYRVAYNLACYEVAMAGLSLVENGHQVAILEPESLADMHMLLALFALREALSGAPGGRRQELGRWAMRDPALEALRDASSSTSVTYAGQFFELLEQYAISLPSATGAGAPADGSTEANPPAGGEGHSTEPPSEEGYGA
jgi:hypothetical protein